jgi:hypothetical protein
MKFCSVGDLHGRDIWRKLKYKGGKPDKIIFVGDYCDSYYLSNEEILDNLVEIINFKKQNPELVELLLGNHDISYMYFPDYWCEGFRADAQPDLNRLLNENRKLFSVAYQYKNYLWTHAGVANEWLSEFKPHAMAKGIWSDQNLAQTFNDTNETSLREKLFQISGKRVKFGVQLGVGGIVWADKSETTEDCLLGHHQIVGHTPVAKNITIKQGEEASVTYIDSLASESGEFYELEIK